MNDFDIKIETPIALYGYTEYGIKQYKMLLKKGFNEIFFFDVRAQEIDCDDFEIYDYRSYFKNKREDIVVIIVMQNIMRHIEIADSLFNEGYGNILFLTNNNDKKLNCEMNKKYNLFIRGRFDSLVNIPQYSSLIKAQRNSKDIIEEDCNYVSLWVSYEYLYTGLPKEENAELMLYCNKCLALNYYYNTLFDFLLHVKGNCDQYIQVYSEYTHKTQKEYFNDRIALFDLYETEFSRGLNFFVNTPALARWNDAGYFNLIDGHHRVSYLYSKGMREYPLMVSSHDYLLYKEELLNEKRRYNFWREILILSDGELQSGATAN